MALSAGARLGIYEIADLISRLAGGSISIVGGALLAISDEGSFVYVPAMGVPSQLRWADRQGRRESLGSEPVSADRAQLSPDGSRLAIERDADIWIYDIARGATSRLTTSGDNLGPLWTPDGKKIIFFSARQGVDQVFWAPADGSGEAEQLTTGELNRHPDAVSPDGALLVFHEHASDTDWDLWLLDLNGDHEARLFLDTPFRERTAAVSPDRQWLAYTSDESGADELLLTPFPTGGSKLPVSAGGGGAPVWSRNGRDAVLSKQRSDHVGLRRGR